MNMKLPAATSTTTLRTMMTTTTSTTMTRPAQRQASLHIAHDTQDDSLLYRSVKDAGNLSFGIVMVEVWTWDAASSTLVLPQGGSWIAASFHCCRSCSNNSPHSLTDSSRNDYVAANPVIPGEGLPGVFWSDANDTLLSNRGGGRQRVLSGDLESLGHVSLHSHFSWFSGRGRRGRARHGKPRGGGAVPSGNPSVDDDVDWDVNTTTKEQPISSSSGGGFLGRLMDRLNPLCRKDSSAKDHEECESKDLMM